MNYFCNPINAPYAVPYGAAPCVSGLRVFGRGNGSRPGRAEASAARSGPLDFTVSAKDGRMDGFVKERYASYESGIGQRIVEGKITLFELADYAAALGAPELPGSGNQEGLQGVVNQILFGGA